MKIKTKLFVLLAIFSMAVMHVSCQRQPTLKALIVTGQNNHKWQGSSVALKQILENSIFVVETSTSPASGQDMSGFIVDFTPYDVVVLDYTGDEWPAETRENFVNYVSNGGGVVVYHATSNAFPDWPEFNEIIGLGGWGGRNEESGPYVYIENGEVVYDESPGRGGTHGRQHEFVVQTFKPDHPVMRGLPEKWLQAKDELYSELRGPAKNLEVLAFAYADKQYGGNERNEPMLMTISYGEGRVFHTALGHAGNRDLFFPAMESAGFIVTLQRGAEWAATGKVTQKVPEAFPTETESMQWRFYRDISDISSITKDLQEYEIGNSNDFVNIFRYLIAENNDNQDKLNEYRKIFRDVLESRRSTIESKKLIMREFSWFTDESFRGVFEDMRQNPELAGEADLALGILGD